MSYQKILDAIPKAEILKYLKKNTPQSVGGREVGASTASRKAMIRKMHEIPVKNSAHSQDSKDLEIIKYQPIKNQKHVTNN